MINAVESRQDLREIFSAYRGKIFNNDPFTDMLINMFERNTLAIELIAKQMKASHLTPEEMYSRFINNTVADLNETFFVKNYDSEKRNAVNHMQRIFNIASLNNEEKHITMCLSLLSISGMNINDFKKCYNLADYSVLNSFIERSWIREADDYISVHPLIRETIKIVLKPDLIKCIDFINGIMRNFPTVRRIIRFL